MARVKWDDRFFASTRGRILMLLRRESQTVDELASALSISDNAVRSHLHALERDGFVTHEGIRRGAGKPAWRYRLAPAAERIFPKPYAAMLGTLLDVLSERLSGADLNAALVETGRRMAATIPPLRGSTDERIDGVMEALSNMGGMAELDISEHTIVIRGHDCPIAGAVVSYPDACHVVQSVLETMLDQPVTEHCDRSDRPKCCFTIATGVPDTDTTT